jgi:ribonuclease HI
VEGEFPNAVTNRLIHNLKKRRIPDMLVCFVSCLLTDRRTKLHFDDYTSEFININNGIGQGDPLSMLLYILYNTDFLEITDDESKEDAIGYVDDIVLVAVGADFMETTQCLKLMMTKDDGGLQWSKDHNSKFEVSKSAVLHLTRKTLPNPEVERGRIQLPRPKLSLEGQEVTEVTCYKYLGVQIDAQLRWKEQAQRATANTTKWILQYRRLTRPSTGVGSKLMRQLYLAVALPKITYGIDIWYTPPNKPVGFTKNTGSVGVLYNLQKAQRLATMAITGTLRSAPTDLLDAHAGLYPMELALRKACHGAILRSISLPATHPIHQIVKSAKRNPPEKHLGPLDQLIKLFKLKKVKLETIKPAIRDWAKAPRFKTVIAGNREDSISFERSDTADFKAFSDGSGRDDGIGAVAILFKKGFIRPTNDMKAYLGHKSKHNTYEAEAVGALFAIWLIRNNPEAIGKLVSLYIDNQAIVMALTGINRISGQHLIHSIITAANGLPCNLTIRWISSHSEVKGNEAADKLAKTAARG